MTVQFKDTFWLYGVPSHAGLDTETSQAADSHLAPAAIRDAYRRMYSGYNIPARFEDKGDLAVTASGPVDKVLTAAEEAVTDAVNNSHRPVMIGGSHTFTLGSLRAIKKAVGDFSLLYYDAHPDLMPDEKIYYGSTLYHGIEEGVLDPKRIGFVGIRQIEEEEQDILNKHGCFALSPVEIATDGISAALSKLRKAIPPPYYISIDLDGLDPAAAPGVTTPYPFGLSRMEILGLTTPFCANSAGELLGFEIVEYSKSRDVNDTTAFLAAALLQHLTAAG